MKKWNFFTCKELKPTGWLKRQLEIQAQGLNGNLDRVWKDVRDSAWIGGDAESWERVPYWLDGFIPLAYILEDADMIGRAEYYVDGIMGRQNADGWICPCKEDEREKYDVWALFLINKALTVYYDCSGEERVIDVIYKSLRNLYELMLAGTIKLFGWGEYRWFEGIISIAFIYERRREQWLKNLALMLKEQGVDYAEKAELWKRPLNVWSMDTHIVNLVMMLKEEAVICDLLDLPYTDKAGKLYRILNEYNGTPTGIFTGDECLSGISPVQGTELCAVAEQMFSYELLYAYTGDSVWAERLEKIAFNALPATLSDDMWTHQYVQQSNQINCARFAGKPVWRTNGAESGMFGLEPNFGCCTANFGQAWSKFALSAFLRNGNTVLSAIPVPSSLRTEAYTVELKTEYPFKNKFIYKISAKENMRLIVRVPSFAQKLRVDGNLVTSAGELSFDVAAGTEREIDISYECVAGFVKSPVGLNYVQWGSLVFSLPITYDAVKYEYVKDGVERKFPYCDYELLGKSEWRYGFVGGELHAEFNGIGGVPFSCSEPPVTVQVELRRVEWEYLDGYDCVCDKLPRMPLKAFGDIVTAELCPYGAAKLRMTELPLCKKS